MGVIPSNQFLDGYTPICNDCGTHLCWDIDSHEYNQKKTFWDDWKCEVCDPNAIGSRKKFEQELINQELAIRNSNNAYS